MKSNRYLFSIQKSHQGFSLLEILVALGVLMIGLSTVIALLGIAVVTHKKSIDSTTASFISQNVFEDIQTKIPLVSKVKQLEVYKKKSSNYPDYFYDVHGQLLDKNGFQVLISVSIYWHGQGKKHSQTFRKIFLRKLPPL